MSSRTLVYLSKRSVLQAVLSCSALAAAPALSTPTALYAQAAPSGNTTQRGTVKTVSPNSLVIISTDAKTDITITPSDATKVLQLAPGSTDPKTAQPATMADVAPGDRVLTIGSNPALPRTPRPPSVSTS